MRIAALGVVVLLAGCELGPNFKEPENSTNAYLSAGESTVQTVALGKKVTAEWWSLFRSPQIDGLVRDAVAGSPDIAGASARLAGAQEVLAAETSGLYPQVNVGASVTREKLNTAAFGLPPNFFALPPNVNVYQLGPSASYTADVFGGVRRGIEERTAQAQASRYQLAAAYQMLTGNVVTEAIEIASERAELAALNDILTLDRQTANLVNTEERAGEVPDTDVASAVSQLDADETELAAPEQRLDVARHTLAVLLGRAPGDWAAPDIDLATLTLPDPVPVSLPSELVHQRPDILAAEANLHAASAAIGMATARLYPSITLSASAGLASVTPGTLFEPSSLLWSIAAGISQPVFDAGMRQAERREALDAFKASAADYRKTVLQAFGQVANLLTALGHDQEMLTAEQRATDEAKESLRLQRISYQGGNTGILPLLDAQREYQRARLGWVQALTQEYHDTAALLVANGGGWWSK